MHTVVHRCNLWHKRQRDRGDTMPLAVGWLPAQKVQTCHGLTPSPRVSDSAIPTDCLSQRHFVVFSSALRRKVFFSCSSPSSYQASFAKTCQGDTLTKLQVSFFFFIDTTCNSSSAVAITTNTATATTQCQKCNEE